MSDQSKISTSGDAARVPTLAEQRRTGVAFSSLLGTFCGLYLDYVLKNGDALGPTPAIIYWLLFVIGSGFFIERDAFDDRWWSRDKLFLLLPGLAIILTFIAPPALSAIASGRIDWLWVRSLAAFSAVIVLVTPPFILIASEAKPTLQSIVTRVITTDENEIDNVGKRVAAAWKVVGLVLGIVQGWILFLSK